jgi:hypothetical protein
MKKPEKGFTCECGTFHEFGAYVAAHSDIELIFTCSKCGRKHIVIGMQAFSVKAKRVKGGAKRFLTQGDNL